MNAFARPQSTAYQKNMIYSPFATVSASSSLWHQQHPFRTCNRTLSLLPLLPRRCGLHRTRDNVQLVKAGSVSFQYEWEAYRAESDFHVRTLKLVREITHTIKQEWDLYNAEWRAQVVTPSTTQQPAQEVAKLDGNSNLAYMASSAAADGREIASGALAGDAASVDYSGPFGPGGYHPVQPGEKFSNGRYTALQQLGLGHYATVWLVEDAFSGQQLAMKVVKSAEQYTRAAHDEVTLLTHILSVDEPPGTSNGGCVRLLDSFEHEGPNGRHICEVFETLGDDLLTLVRVYNHRGLPLSVVRHLARQTLQALDHLHTNCNIIHTDLKPENVMLTERVPRFEAADGSVAAEAAHLADLEPRLLDMGCKIVDFGNACWSDCHHTEVIQTRHYRAPEVILSAGFGDSADIWSLACMVFELVTGDCLFNPREQEGEGAYTEDEDHLAQMMELLQAVPQDVAAAGDTAHHFFTDDGQLRGNRQPRQTVSLDVVLQQKYKLPKEEAEALCDFLLPMLSFDSRSRASAAEMLRHPWLAHGFYRATGRDRWAPMDDY